VSDKLQSNDTPIPYTAANLDLGSELAKADGRPSEHFDGAGGRTNLILTLKCDVVALNFV
jgi:hypothetical protein